MQLLLSWILRLTKVVIQRSKTEMMIYCLPNIYNVFYECCHKKLKVKFPNNIFRKPSYSFVKRLHKNYFLMVQIFIPILEGATYLQI